MVTLSDQVERQIELLSTQILEADFRGFDPYDMLEWFVNVPDNFWGRFLLKSANRVNRVAPLAARRLLGVKKQLNPKTLGLCLRGFGLLQERETGGGNWRAAADRAIELLLATRTVQYSTAVWGYPFDWRSKILIPKGTPSAVVNSIIADGFMEWYRLSGERQFLEMSCDICDFFVHHLNRSTGPEGSLCFSYTPLDNFHVHNANLFVAETLIKVGLTIGRSEWIELGKRAAQYALADQRKNGSLSYWATDQAEAGNPRIDHYHTGFEIRMLHRIGRGLDDPQLLSAARRYYDFYRQHLLYQDNDMLMPKYMPDRIYPVDIHSCAELIMLNSELAADNMFPESLEILQRGAQWVFENMVDERGHLYARIEALRNFKVRVRIPYMRWGLAWMLLALALCKPRLNLSV
jgi:hypothetical protein